MMHRTFRFCAAILFMIFSLSAAHAQPPIEALPKDLAALSPASLLPAKPETSFVFTDSANKANPGSFEHIADIDGQLRFRGHNNKASTGVTAVNAQWRTASPIRKGNVLFVRFYARAIEAKQESGEAEGFFFFQSLSPGADRDFAQAISVGPEWTLINAPFVAVRDYAPGEASMMLAFSNLEQTIEYAAIEVVNFENRLAITDLPVTKFTYAGREEDARWRKDALKRIDELRTAPISIKLISKDGRPIKGADVRVEMVRSAFLWGTSVSAERITDTDADAERYRTEIKQLFDVTVIENGFKWPRWIEPEYRARALTSLDWLRKEGKLVKGHNLAWPAWKFTPGPIANDPEARKNIQALNDAHITELLAATKGKLIGWDVVNEPVNTSDYYKFMPRDHIANWFKMAEASDPKLQLTMNEYGMLNRATSPLMIIKFQDLAADLRSKGARIDVLGVQGHVGQTPRPPVGILADLDLFAAKGDTVQITEFDFNTKDLELQRDYTRDFLIALYSHKAVSGFIMWGFWEAEHWKPDAAMFRPDWTPKPNLAVWKDLVLDQWRTKFSTTSASDGTVSGKGHLGTYKITVTHKGKTSAHVYALDKAASPAEIKLR